MLKYSIFIISIFLMIISCSKKELEVVQMKDTDLNTQMIEAYNEGLDFLDKGDAFNAAKKFSEAEILFPQSLWAPRSSLMTAYSYYVSGLYEDSISELNRYLKTYPMHDRKNYGYYLLALSYYEQIVDEKKDLNPLVKAKENFNIIINNYPNSEFAIDSEYKLELINEILASKEIYLARFYIEKEKWIPAINRLKTITTEYDRTIYVEEALHRLVEIHYKLGLKDEAQRYASTLGYNYQSGDWYEKTYKIFNKKYSKVKLKKIDKKNNSILKRFKSLIN